MRPRARPAISAALVAPAASASSMAVPDTPNTSLATPESLMFAPSSSFSTRLRAAVRVSISARRWRSSSRRSRIAGGGTKLLATRPWRIRLAIHSASFTSVLRPGTLRMCEALPTMRVKGRR